MPSKANIPKILLALQKYSWTRGEFFKEVEGNEYFNPIGMLIREIGVSSMEVPFFAWLLRHEAFVRFGFDPDDVFGEVK